MSACGQGHPLRRVDSEHLKRSERQTLVMALHVEGVRIDSSDIPLGHGRSIGVFAHSNETCTRHEVYANNLEMYLVYWCFQCGIFWNKKQGKSERSCSQQQAMIPKNAIFMHTTPQVPGYHHTRTLRKRRRQNEESIPQPIRVSSRFFLFLFNGENWKSLPSAALIRTLLTRPELLPNMLAPFFCPARTL